MPTKTIHLHADRVHFNSAMFSADLLHNSNDGNTYQILTSDIAVEESYLFQYLTPAQAVGKVGDEFIVTPDPADYEHQQAKLAEKQSDHLVDLPRKAVAVMAFTGLHIFYGYTGDVWKYTDTEMALRANEATKAALEGFLPTGAAAFIEIDGRGNWMLLEKPMGHVYRKETDVPEEIVRHILVEEILRSYDVRTH